MSDTGHQRPSAARSMASTYRLLGRLFASGPEDLSAALAAYPRLAECAPEAGAGDPDRAAADHFATLGFSVLPVAGVFLSEDALVGGESARSVATIYRAAGFTPDPSLPSPDHLAAELAFLAACLEVEAASPRVEPLTRCRDMQRAFLDDHFLVWLPSLVLALTTTDSALYERAARLALVTGLSHREQLGPPWPPADDTAGTSEFPALKDPNTSLRQIVDHLSIPARCGVYLTKDAIAALAQPIGVPCGFGSRRQLLGNLFRASSEYDLLGPALAALRLLLDQQRDYLDAIARRHSLGARYTDPWRGRLVTTCRLLDSMARAAGNHREVSA